MYSESKKEFDYIPQWVLNLIKFGYRWSDASMGGKRRVGIVSTPCNSSAAGLIALGALRKDLEKENANNLHNHFQHLIRTRDSLTTEEKNQCILIDDVKVKWHFTEDTNPSSISLVKANYSDYIKRKGKTIPNPSGPVIRTIYPIKASSIRFLNQPEVEVKSEGKKLSRKDYSLIPEISGKILEENLARSYFGILLIGKATGKGTKYVDDLYDIHFYNDESIVSLGNLLTLHHDKYTPISRLVFCNLSEINAQNQQHYLVVADGARAFCAAMKYFQHSDVVGVCSRDEPADNIENLTNQISSMNRYYIDSCDSELFQLASKSIPFRILERRL